MNARSLRFLSARIVLAALSVLLLPFAAGAQTAPGARDSVIIDSVQTAPQTVVIPAPAPAMSLPALGLAGAVSAQRFLNADFPGVPYYCAYYSTGAEREEFLDYGDEVTDANYAYAAGDGHRSQWATAGKHKDHDQHMRFGTRGMAWRRMAGRL